MKAVQLVDGSRNKNEGRNISKGREKKFDQQAKKRLQSNNPWVLLCHGGNCNNSFFHSYNLIGDESNKKYIIV